MLRGEIWWEGDGGGGGVHWVVKGISEGEVMGGSGEVVNLEGLYESIRSVHDFYSAFLFSILFLSSFPLSSPLNIYVLIWCFVKEHT